MYLFDGRSFAALLFDMDGTVLNSIEATERVWARWAARHGLDVHALLRNSHGRRALDTVLHLGIPGLDAEAEAAEVLRMEMADVAGIHAICGAREFLRSLPAGGWAIVTSAPRALAQRRLAAAGLAAPGTLITADDIATGKPDPSGYRLAASRLGASAADCVVFEDAAAGITAGEAAGARVVVISAAHRRPVPTSHPTFHGFDELRIELAAGRMKIAHELPRQP
ncbi:MAG TPA: HAD-IA family hydrolase [Steroidobacteraceae bacterium]|nr:HAD-IA family hydrolase [Gammaproteobacteria bacterium]HEV2285177.1 HAD-IA family hydrolase [Steroidobacteraceae bacterium]